MKQNCWDVKSCGRCTTKLGDEACPVCKETKLDGVHGGVNGGRACWTIPHTKCGGSKQGSLGQKFIDCAVCDFYNMVKKEEGDSFQHPATLLGKLWRGRRLN